MDRRPATYQDVIDAPEGVTAELIDGELFLMTRPAEPHLVTGSRMGAELITRFYGRDADGPGGWVILHEPELWLGRPEPKERVLVPDVAGWRLDRYPGINPAGVGFEVAPDWVCEILSPSSVRHDRIRKLEVYRQAGIPWAWIVDPLAETVEVFQLRDEHWTLIAAIEDVDGATIPPFDAVSLRVRRWWRSALAGATGPGGEE